MKLRVLIDVRKRHASNNPYIALLVEELRHQGCEVHYFGWLRALFGRYSVLHLNWPEHLFSHSRRWVSLVNTALGVILVVRLTVDPKKIVYTKHNRASHSPASRAVRFLVDRLMGRVDVEVVMNSADLEEPLRKRSRAWIAHGDYRGWPAFRRGASVRKSRPSPRLLSFGIIKPYKGQVELVEAAAKSSFGSVLIVGECADEGYCNDLLRAAGRSGGRVSVEPNRIGDDRLAAEVTAATVVVLNYTDFYNSGALILSLTLGTPVAAPLNRYTLDLQLEFGDDWIYLYDRPISKIVLAEIEEWAIMERETWPDMQGRSWEGIARQYYALYLELMSDMTSTDSSGDPLSAG